MNRLVLALGQFAALLGFWFALSGRFEPLFVALGVATAATATALTHHMAGAGPLPGAPPLPLRRLPLVTARAIGLAVWLSGRVLVGGVQVALTALSPAVTVAPCVLRFRTELEVPLARTVLTNAISLVPGTITVDIDGQDVVVHALSPAALEDLVTGELQNRVARVFLEPRQPPVGTAGIEIGGAP